MKNLSVIVPVYNVEKYLERSLDSLINQTYKDLEIIIVNDGSTDSSREILRKYENLENVHIFDKENGGVNTAREFALKKVKTEYVTFLDSDDFIDLDTYEISMNKIKEDRDIDIFMFNHYSYFENSNKYINNLNIEDEFTYIDNIMKCFLLCKINPFLWNKIYKTRLFDGLKYPDVRSHDDMIVVFYALNKCNCFLLWNKPKLYYLQRQNSITTAPNEKIIRGYIKAVNEIDKGIKESRKYRDILLTELEFFKVVRIVNIMRALTKMNNLNTSYKMKMLDIKTDLKLLKKAKNIYGINSRFFVINVLFSINKTACYYLVKMIRKIKRSDLN